MHQRKPNIDLYFLPSSNGVLRRPFLKWAGGKYKIVDQLKKCFPKSGRRFVEPFVGGGSVAFNVDYNECIINDINRDLCDIYSYLQSYGEMFIRECKALFTPENNTLEKYSQFRNEFNQSRNRFFRSKVLVYLNRHCFNGLVRYNSKGIFNVPFGNYKSPYFPKKEFLAAARKVERMTIKNRNFRDIFQLAEKDDVIYCDPPYVPISSTSSFKEYSSNGFTIQDQCDLAKCANEAKGFGATVIISNSNTKFTRELYRDEYGAKLRTLKVARTINSKGDKRGVVSELIAVFSPDKS